MSTYNGVSILNVRALRGPNLYAYMPVLHVTLDIGPYEHQPSNSFPGFVERLVEWLPDLEKHECSLKRPGGFITRMLRGTYLAHICEHVALELQTMMGFRVAFGRARGTGKKGIYTVVIEYKEEKPAIAAFETALRLTLAAMHDEPFDIQAEMQQLMEIADEYRLGPSTAAIVNAARARKIPVLRVTPTGSLVQLGYGVHQKRILASETTYTSAIAVDLCQDKSLTINMLSRVGVPIPEGQLVKSADAAWQAAQEIGLPVVVKPADGNQGKGVSVNLTTEIDVRAAFNIAQQYSSRVQVEQYIRGHDYRLLVINGKLVAAARRDPAQVVGDGTHTVAELIEVLNQDPRRRPGHSGTLTRVEPNAAVELTLSQQGLTLSSVPEVGQKVLLRNNCNLSTGGTAANVTADVHPDNQHMAELVAQYLGLDVAGIDVLCQDIGRPLTEQGGAIVEVNAAPGLRMHLDPSGGAPIDVGTPIIEMLYPGDSPSRIPIIAVTGTNGKTTVTRLIDHIYATGRWTVGMTCTDGIYIDGERITAGDCSGPQSAQAVLLHPHVEVAVLETARGGILREGLVFDECLVGVVTNVTADHLGLKGIDTLDELAKVKQVVIEAVSRNGKAVLNAEDPRVAGMASATDAEIVYFGRSATHPVMAAHLMDGGMSVFVHQDSIILAKGQEWYELVELSRVPFTMGGKIGFQVLNALAGVAATWAAGLNPAIIERGLVSFVVDAQKVPGRFNQMTINDVEVLLDYGHNPAALCALGEAVQALEPRRTIMALCLPGDRSDDDLMQSVLATVPYVDSYVLFNSVELRGRAVGEVPQLIRQHIPCDVPCVTALDQHEAILTSFRLARPGDRIIHIADTVDEALAELQALAVSHTEDHACGDPIAVPPYWLRKGSAKELR
jgi:cyanophycin synthetase